VRPVCADFTGAWELPAGDEPERRRVIFFPGSTVGNLTPAETVALFRHARQLAGPGGGFLLGADLKKEPSRLHAAYNDAAGVTAAFNLNLLARINRELGGTFDLAGFWHHAFYEPRAGRIEMHLLCRADQRARIADQEFTFAEGESILTEYSYKYTIAGLRSLAEAGGWRLQRVWTDARRDFAVGYLEARS
jgi:dimethylhistidine N-methyltransferase